MMEHKDKNRKRKDHPSEGREPVPKKPKRKPKETSALKRTIIKKPREFSRDWPSKILTKEQLARLTNKGKDTMPVGQLPTGDVKKPVLMDRENKVVWKGPYDLTKGGDARRVSRHWQRTEAFKAWGVGVPQLEIFVEDEKKTRAWLCFEMLVSKQAIEKKQEWKTEKRETKGVSYTILDRASLGVLQLHQVDPKEFERPEIVAQFILSFVARYIVQPPTGDSGMWNNLMVDDKIYAIDLEDDRGRFDEQDADLPEWAEFASGQLHVESTEKKEASKSWYDYVFCTRKPSKKARKYIDKAIVKHRDQLQVAWAAFEARVRASNPKQFPRSLARLETLKRVLFA